MARSDWLTFIQGYTILQVMKIVTEFHSTSKVIECTLWLSDPLWHPRRNTLAAIAVKTDGEIYILPVNHNDAGNNVITIDRFRQLVSDCTIYTNDQKTFLHYIGQVGTLHQCNKHNLTERDARVRPYLGPIGGNIRNGYQAVPLTILAHWMAQDVSDLTGNVVYSPFFTEQYIPCLARLETPGICVNPAIMSVEFPRAFKRHLTSDNLVYPWYNPFTSAHRASNSWAGINFSALTKGSDSRKMIISRFDGGSLVSMDFDAYHLRLIAQYFDVPLPQTSLHTEFAKLYFNTPEVTPEQYELSKQKTFELMYGKIVETHGIPLFERIGGVKEQLWNEYTQTRTLPLATGMSVPVENPHPSKLFNYFVQSLEVRETVIKLIQVLDWLETKQSKLILYTYDSILLDVHPSEDVSEIRALLEEPNHMFPVRVYEGTNYANLKEVPCEQFT